MAAEDLRKVPKPKTAALMGWTFESHDEDTAEVTISFDGKEDFTNPVGYIQGGFIAAMLDDAIGPALIIAAKGEKFSPTIDLHTHFLRPVRPGRITVKARPIQMSRNIAFAEAELFDARGRLCARATSSNSMVALPAGLTPQQPVSMET